MRPVDRLLQRWRIREAAPFVRSGDRLLDIGCFDGAFIEAVLPRIDSAVGIDPLATPKHKGKVVILRDRVSGRTSLDAESFDCIAMLATLEHMDDPTTLTRECHRLLKPGGRLIFTVPHPLVDRIIPALVWLGASEPVDLEGHHGFDVTNAERLLLDVGFRPLTKRVFQLGLNRLYVFEKPGATKPRR